MLLICDVTLHSALCSFNMIQHVLDQTIVFYLKDELKAKDPDLLKLGLLYEVGVDAVTVQEPETLLSFQHKSLQEFACSKHLAKKLDNIMEEGQDVKVNLEVYTRCNGTVLSWLLGKVHGPVGLIS